MLACMILVSACIFAADDQNNAEPSPKLFIINSPPKCGTHLVAKTLELITNQPPSYQLLLMQRNDKDMLKIILTNSQANTFTVAHCLSPNVLKTLVELDYKIIFMIRDPRDQLISIMKWLQEGKWILDPIAKVKDPKRQIHELITGEITRHRCVETKFLAFEKHLENIPQSNLFVTSYEKLVGPKGNGSAEVQVGEILGLANFIGIDLTSEQVDHIADNVYGDTKTFRTAKIGNWKNYFTERDKEDFKKFYSELLLRLGYEENNDW